MLLCLEFFWGEHSKTWLEIETSRTVLLGGHTFRNYWTYIPVIKSLMTATHIIDIPPAVFLGSTYTVLINTKKTNLSLLQSIE
jgi:hypothetical protein